MISNILSLYTRQNCRIKDKMAIYYVFFICYTVFIWGFFFGGGVGGLRVFWVVFFLMFITDILFSLNKHALGSPRIISAINAN